MSVDLAEDSLDLMIELLEVGNPSQSSYPYPTLRRTNRLERRSFRVFTVSNPYLEATVVPDLGGRILRLRKPNSGEDLIPFEPTLQLIHGGLRGIQCPAGIQVRTGFEDRLNSMGTVSAMPDFRQEGEPDAIWWGELCGSGLSLNVRISLPEDRAALTVETRVFNRTLEPVPYNGGIAIGGSQIFGKSAGGWIFNCGSEMFIRPVDGLLDYADAESAHRFDRVRWLAPHQLDSWIVEIFPSRIGDTLRGADRTYAVGWDDQVLRVQSRKPIHQAKVVIQVNQQGPMELVADLGPDQVSEFSLEDLPMVEQVALKDSDGITLVVGNAIKAVELSSNPPEPKSDSMHLRKASLTDLQRLEFEPGNRAIAHFMRGAQLNRRGDFAGAALQFEQSLLFNAEDHLAWWLKAVCERLSGRQDEESQEILNAHFIAPMEPVLRAESYLSSPSQIREKTAVVTPLSEFPESLVDIACLLIEFGLLEEASKWIDEALRHADLSILRYLLAYALLQGSRMDVQAAEQVMRARTPDASPPFPFRPIELEALSYLQEKFPDDQAISRLLDLANEFAN
ncbi:MAG TPA: DUF5107 domain-containing protein [Fimbriimonadaceae bacterium]|nr:DUF5107 domain-containing protein [Fimbriimonadaceae bacterium]